MNPLIKKLQPIVQRDARYMVESYEFVMHALDHTHKMLGRRPPDQHADPEDPRFHVTVRQWVEGICDHARREFGLMAPVVFRMWGVRNTDDFGEIVFNLIDAGLMTRTADESRADFHAVLDLDTALVQGFRIVVEEE
jgi:uncharacterized repeat protein (TIGR04138 family)